MEHLKEDNSYVNLYVVGMGHSCCYDNKNSKNIPISKFFIFMPVCAF
jgi:hypothetical protein